MSIYLEIPDTVAQAMRLPDSERKQRLMTELAVSLYAQRILSFGKARQLAEMSKKRIRTDTWPARDSQALRTGRYAG